MFLLALLGGVGLASYALWSRAQKLPEGKVPDALPPAERTLGNLRVDDVLQHLGTDWLVEGVLSLAEDGRGTRVCALSDGSKIRYLFTSTIEDDPVFLDAASELRVDGDPDTVSARGQTFTLKTRAAVAMQRAGIVLAERGRADSRVRFAEYAAGGQRLLVIHFADGSDAFVGERIASHLVEILPGG
jgi:hypothetical protein